ncbi:hypothetical protein DUI87_33463 [Hirundo rustica rustica]|uniref:Uncharacterized protein n=1 Tax=Hirundo rustica rustica TaxID=333673 RepID=A0A3M0ITD1_HIRRU|nr:hypothetical protein DUI87_33463 [Hirundo rustica rustica]
MGRRNTYVCSERPGGERHLLLPNGKDRVSLDPSRRQSSNRCVSATPGPGAAKIRSQTNLRESGDLRSQVAIYLGIKRKPPPGCSEGGGL